MWFEMDDYRLIASGMGSFHLLSLSFTGKSFILKILFVDNFQKLVRNQLKNKKVH